MGPVRLPYYRLEARSAALLGGKWEDRQGDESEEEEETHVISSYPSWLHLWKPTFISL
jgi:hypothetical protein